MFAKLYAMNRFKKVVLGLLFCGLLGLVALSNSYLPATSQVRKSEPVLIPPALLERFTFGYNELIADLLWLRAIQDFDFCGRKITRYNEDLKKDEVVCNSGWLFKMLDAATRVAPRHRILYTRGAVYLSVIVSDRDGAATLLARGAETLFDHWYVLYCAGYHFHLEMKDDVKAAFYMNEAAKYGAPNWVVLLSAKLYSAGGRAEFGLKALEQFYGTLPFEEWPTRAIERWRELEATLGHKVEPQRLPPTVDN